MNLDVFTIVLDGCPMMLWHLPMLTALPPEINWHYTIVEGVSANVNCTKWCSSQSPRLSKDGTTAYLNSLRNHPRITIIQKQLWSGGKLEMVNAAVSRIKRETVLLEIDCDECWQTNQLETIVTAFNSNLAIQWMKFFCTYFVGVNIVIVSENTYGNRDSEWARCWRFKPGMTFSAHEPPILNGITGIGLTREETRKMGLVFQHFAYAFAEQVMWKEKFYKYPNATDHWRRLQRNKVWPVRLRDFLPWVKDNAVADILWK